MENIELVGFLDGIGRTSLQAGVLVLVVLAAQWLFRKQLTPRWRCSLWLLVVARLLLPVSFGTAVSIFNLLPRWTERADRSLAPTRPSFIADRGTESATASQAPPRVTQSIPARPQLSEPAKVPDNPVSDGVSLLAGPRPATPAYHPPYQKLSWAGLLFWSWLAGAFGLAGYVVISSLRLARTFSGLRPLTDPVVLAVFADCRTRMNIHIRLSLVESRAVSCPALYGLFHPRLVLPLGFAIHFSEHELRFIFLHELAHLKRLDLPLNWLFAVLQVIHWFNPLVWVGFAR